MAISGLVRLGAPEAAGFVRTALKEGQREAGAWAALLGDATMKEEVAAWALQVQGVAACSYFFAIGDEPRLIALLRTALLSADPLVWIEPYAALMGEGALVLFLEMTQSSNAKRRMAGVAGLSLLRGAKARAALVSLVKTADADLKKVVVDALFRGDDRAAVDGLLELLNDHPASSYFLRTRAFVADHPKLRGALKSTDFQVVNAAMDALMMSGTDGARESVAARIKELSLNELQMLGVGLPGVRERLLELPSERTNYLLARGGDVKAAQQLAADAIRKGDFAWPVPLHLLPPPERATYVAAAMEAIALIVPQDRGGYWVDLADEGVPEAAAALVELARLAALPMDSNELSYLLGLDPALVRPHIVPLLASGLACERQLAAHVLGTFGDPADAVRVAKLLKDPVATVRAEGVRALAMMHATESIPEIARLVADPVEEVRLSALSALMALGAGPVETLKALADDPSPAVRRKARVVRAALGDVSCVDDLLRALKEDPSLPTRALAKAGCTAMIAYLRDRIARFLDRQAAADLAAMGDADAIAWLRKEGSVESAAVLLGLGLHESPIDALSRLEWSSIHDASPLFLALNRLADEKRYSALNGRWRPARWVGPAAGSYAKTLAGLTGLPVRMDASAAEFAWPLLMEAGFGLPCKEGLVPVFDGDGITLYSFAAARLVWEGRLKKK